MVRALRRPRAPSATTSREERNVSRYQPPSGCGARSRSVTSSCARAHRIGGAVAFARSTRPPPARRASSAAFTAGHSRSTMLNRTVSRTTGASPGSGPAGTMRSLRRTPSRTAPSLAIARWLCRLPPLVANWTRTAGGSSRSKACRSMRNFASGLTCVPWCARPIQVRPISTPRRSGAIFMYVVRPTARPVALSTTAKATTPGSAVVRAISRSKPATLHSDGACGVKRKSSRSAEANRSAA